MPSFCIKNYWFILFPGNILLLFPNELHEFADQNDILTRVRFCDCSDTGVPV